VTQALRATAVRVARVGAVLTARVPHVDGAHYAVQARDDAGNLSPLPVRAAAVPAAPAAGSSTGDGRRLADTGASDALAGAGALLLLVVGVRRRRFARG
jgi:hypothetical protein